MIIVLFILIYLFASIPMGLVLCKLLGYGDIRKIGSGNIGATNVLRASNKYIAIITALLDISKGLIAVIIMQQFFNDQHFIIIAGIIALLGHIFPIWLLFKGGKGVATAIGLVVAVEPLVGILLILTWLFVLIISKISSLSALTTFLLLPFYAKLIGNNYLTYYSIIIVLIIFIKHWSNIKRIVKGQEPKVSFKKNDG